jgi:MFS family permease
MHVRHPVWLQRFATPGADAIAFLFSLESFARALLASFIVLEAYALLGDAGLASGLFFAASAVGLCSNFAIPTLVRRVGRRWVYTSGGLLLALAPAVLFAGSLLGSLPVLWAGMALRTLAIVSLSICLNLYILENVRRRDLGRSEPKRLFYSAGAWTLGPGLGVYLGTAIGPWAAYAASGFFAVCLLGYFWFLRLSESPALPRTASRRAPNPVQNVRRYLAQPRLVLAWFIAISRNVWWVLFFIYTPIYAVETGLGAIVGGVIVSAGTGFLFLMPAWSWCVRTFGMWRLLMVGFSATGILTLLVAAASGEPWLAAGLLLAAALSMVSLDAIGNAPFLMAVRPAERSEMTPVYATYRDVAEIMPPGVFALLLMVFPLPAVFVVGGLATLAAGQFCRSMHPRLGRSRRPPQPAPALCAPEPVGPDSY